MYKNEFTAASKGAAAKSALLRNNPAGYFLLSMLAGAYIGFGILLVFTVSGQLNGAPYTKLLMGICFGVALSLVIIAGAELFTGNNFVMAAGLFRKTVTLGEAVRLWIVCWIGNLLGAVVLAFIFNGSGLYAGPSLAAMAAGAAAKMTAPALALFCRGMLCNVLVCLAVWCGFRTQNDAAKLLMVFWCLLAFFTTGFEHSVANMTLLTLGLINDGGVQGISFGGYVYNLLIVTAGNMAGAILCLALPYHLASKEK